jgi:hypothetical protein
MKVGILSPGKREDTVCLPNNQGGEVGCFIEAFRTLGHNDGQNVAVNYLFAEGAPETTSGLAVQLVRLRPGCHLHIHQRWSRRSHRGYDHDPHRRWSGGREHV